jgi:hypothetical protein
MKNEILQSSDYLNVSDFPLIVTLSLYSPIVAIDKSDPRRTNFVFEKTKNLMQIIEQYHKKELLVEPQSFHYATKEIKARLYSAE